MRTHTDVHDEQSPGAVTPPIRWPHRTTILRWKHGTTKPSKRNEAVLRALELLKPLAPAETEPRG
jgi:hypothetical protein